jgi:serine/threonine protein kinase/tetratricopeptide (TPR) repeat protein
MSETPEELVFAAALEIANPADREKYLDAACGDDAALRRRLDELLASHGRASRFLEVPAIGAAGVTTDPNSSDSSRPPFVATRPPSVVPGTQIGPYTLVRKLGEGGMGAVYLAAQEQPVRRQVALKIIKPGMGGEQVIARFAAERQALERMEHPNIARVLDAGTTQAGLPYFVMELVEGVPITQYCDEKRLTPRQRLELFIPVCHAVQHAHQKGIIHRDLKPSNVLVAVYDAKPVPKVIDFGVAKAVEKLQVEQTAFTQLGVLIGTPEYMSPEQADLDAAGVDTRSDIYSLGVVLYELLTGTTPLEAQRLRQVGWAQMLKSIREDHPPRPSTRLSTSGAARAEISARRGTEARRLQRLLMGDLDQVVMKALEKECDRRYQTANGLARDIERYLDDEPVEARGPSTTYRLRKFAYKHRIALTVATGFAAVLIAGTTVSTVEAIRAKHARNAALTAEGNAKAQRDVAIREQERADDATAAATATNEFLNQYVLGLASPQLQADQGRVPIRDITLREALDRAAGEVGNHFANQPPIEFRLRCTIGHAYHDLGEYQKACGQLEAAVALSKKVAVDRREVIRTNSSLASTYVSLGRFNEAETLYKHTIEESVKAVGEVDPDTLYLFQNLGSLYATWGRFTEAQLNYQRVLDADQKILGPDHPTTLAALGSLAVTYTDQGRYREALPLLEQVLRASRVAFGSENPVTLNRVNNLGMAYLDAGKPSLAEPLLLDALKAQRRTLGVGHPDTARTANNLAILYDHQERYEEATGLLTEALRQTKSGPGSSPQLTLTLVETLAAVYESQGRVDEADAMYQFVLSQRRAVMGPRHPATLSAMNNFAELLSNGERMVDAEALFRETISKASEILGRLHPETLRYNSNLSGVYRREGRFDEAERLDEAVIEGYRKTTGSKFPSCLITMNNLAILYFRQGRYAEAEKLLDEVLQSRREVMGDSHPATLAVLLDLANLHARRHDFDRAEVVLRSLAEPEGRNSTTGKAQRDQARSHLAAIGRARQAEAAYISSASEGAGKDSGADVFENRIKWALALREAGAYDEAGNQFQSALASEYAKHSSVGRIRCSCHLAIIHHLQGKNDLAGSQFMDLLRAGRSELGTDNPVTVQILHEMIQFFRDEGRFDPHVLDDVVAVLGPEERNTGVPLMDLGGKLVDRGNYNDAEVLLRKAVELSEQNDPAGWTKYLARSRLGGSLAGERKFDEGESWLLDGYEQLKSHEAVIPPKYKPFVAEARRRLASLYEAWGKPDEAQRWRIDPLPTDPPTFWETVSARMPSTQPAN